MPTAQDQEMKSFSAQDLEDQFQSSLSYYGGMETVSDIETYKECLTLILAKLGRGAKDSTTPVVVVLPDGVRYKHILHLKPFLVSRGFSPIFELEGMMRSRRWIVSLA